MIEIKKGVEGLKKKLVKKAKQEGIFDLSPENEAKKKKTDKEVSKNQFVVVIRSTRPNLPMYL